MQLFALFFVCSVLGLVREMFCSENLHEMLVLFPPVLPIFFCSVPAARIRCSIHDSCIIHDGTNWKQKDYLKATKENAPIICMWLVVELAAVILSKIQSSSTSSCYLCRQCRRAFEEWKRGDSDAKLIVEAASVAKGERRERKREDPRIACVSSVSSVQASVAPAVLLPVSPSPASALSVTSDISSLTSTSPSSTPIFLSPSLTRFSSSSSSSSCSSSSSSSQSPVFTSSSSSVLSSSSSASSSSGPSSASSHHHSCCCGSSGASAMTHLRSTVTRAGIQVLVFFPIIIENKMKQENEEEGRDEQEEESLR
jgi:hypothetical protein